MKSLGVALCTGLDRSERCLADPEDREARLR